MQKRNKQSVKLDLQELHGVCEANYARLMCLYPDYESCNTRSLLVGSAKVRLDVLERARYTTIFQLNQWHAGSRWLGRLRVELRTYHDASMVEVGMFQSHRRIAGRYSYPNEHMFQQDEKFQQNRFLADWLDHCLQNGRLGVDVTAPLTGA
ncbi:MAG: hypothetical protein ACI9NT_001561 [Bacteroidia bacterium]